MATRFYLPETSDAPDISPVVRAADWGSDVGEETEESFVRRKTDTIVANTALTTTTESGLLKRAVWRQYISNPLTAQTITGTFSMVIKGSSNMGGSFLQVVVKVVSSDGSTVRGVTLPRSVNSSAYPSGTMSTRRINAVSLTNVNSSLGDYLVIEIASTAGTDTSTTSSLVFGDNAGSDFALSDGLTTNLNPWCEFSMDIEFYDGIQNSNQLMMMGVGT